MAHYDPKEVTLLVGPAIISGYADDTFINIEYDEDTYTLMTGCDGETIRSRSHVRSAKITISLMPSSIANTILMAYHVADLAGNAGAVTLAIRDGSNNTIHSSEGVWVEKTPGREYGKEAKAVQWVLRAARLETVFGFSLEAP